MTTPPPMFETAVPLCVEERNLIRAALLAYERMLRDNVTGRLGGQLDADEIAENRRLIAAVRAKLAAAVEAETAAFVASLLA